MTDNVDGDDQEDEELDEETQDRIERVRGKRDSRPSRRRGRSRQTPESDQPPQAKQVEQDEQTAETAETAQETDMVDTNSQTETEQTEQVDNVPQAPQAEQVTQSEGAKQTTVSELEPVTQREHDTYYLDEAVREELERVYRRMSLDILEETGVDLDEQRVGGRNRYFRPLALLLGARELADMSPDELRKTVEEEDLVDDLPESEK